MTQNARVWRDPRLITALEDRSHKKCWYCESKENRSDRHVDHFRPKGRVKGTDHGGYYWLAFKGENYRLACTYCNCHRTDRENGEVLGKGDSFPLENEDQRISDPTIGYDQLCRQERPTLIDPCKPTDVVLIDFQDDGSAIERFKEEKNPTGHKRAKASIDLYHLNERDIKDARQGLYQRIKDLVARIDREFNHALDQDSSAENSVEDSLRDLKALRAPDAEYSAFAKAMIASFQSETRPWLSMLD
ncbi:hypothetical protein QEH57_16195 [Pelagicoccus sp. SDUM812005]|nr:hypothetical protein [Pelagicoccus sp. SDUM812005]